MIYVLKYRGDLFDLDAINYDI